MPTIAEILADNAARARARLDRKRDFARERMRRYRERHPERIREQTGKVDLAKRRLAQYLWTENVAWLQMRYISRGLDHHIAEAGLEIVSMEELRNPTFRYNGRLERLSETLPAW